MDNQTNAPLASPRIVEGEALLIFGLSQRCPSARALRRTVRRAHWPGRTGNLDSGEISGEWVGASETPAHYPLPTPRFLSYTWIAKAISASASPSIDTASQPPWCHARLAAPEPKAPPKKNTVT